MSCLRKKPLSCNYNLCVTGPTGMYCKFVFATLAVLIGNEFVSSQQIPQSTTAGELWNPWTWFWPYAIASAEAYRDYYAKAQKATNELYQQIYKTNAFPWVTGNWGPQINPIGGQSNLTGGTGTNPTGGSGQTNPTGGSGQSNPTGGSGQSNPTGGSGQSNPTGGSGGSESSGQNNPTGGSGGSDQSNPTNNSGGSPDAQVQANA